MANDASLTAGLWSMAFFVNNSLCYFCSTHQGVCEDMRFAVLVRVTC